jgi:hypothetical protein
MVERGSGPRFAQEARAHFIVWDFFREELYGYAALQLQIGCAKDNAHRASPNFTIKMVALSQDQAGRRRGEPDFRRIESLSFQGIVLIGRYWF